MRPFNRNKNKKNKRKYFMGKLKKGIPVTSRSNLSNLWVWTGEVALDGENNIGPILETIASTSSDAKFTTSHTARASGVRDGWIRMATKEDIKRMKSWKEEYSRFFTF
jgi:hypothetical protein